MYVIDRIHVEPITHGVEYVVDYISKAFNRRRFTTDDILLLPRTIGELGEQGALEKAGIVFVGADDGGPGARLSK
jgi:hypothetical protein